MYILLTIFLIIFTNMASFGIIIPLTPTFQYQFNLSSFQMGLLAGSFPFAQIISGILLGFLSDKHGRRNILLFSAIITTISYILLGMSHSYIQIILSRLLGGFSTGSLAVAMAVGSDISTRENRKKYMGIIGMAFGFGFMIGPAIGGFLAGSNVHTASIARVAFTSGALSIVPLACIFLWLPETYPKERRVSFNLLSGISDLLSNHFVLINYILNSCISAMIAGLEVFATLWFVFKFNFSPIYIAFFWTFFALFINMGRSLLLKHIHSYRSQAVAFIIISASILVLSFADSKLIVFTSLAIFAGLIGAIMTATTTNISLNSCLNKQGLSLGLNNSIANMGRSLGPVIIGFIMSLRDNNYSFAWVTLALIGALGALLSLFLHSYQKKKTILP